MSAYLGSTPTAPLDPGTIEFVKGKPAIVQPARDLHYYEDHWEKLNQRHYAERGKFLSEFKESGTWRSKYKTWQQCCDELLHFSKRHVDRQIADHCQSNAGHACPVSDKEDTLERLSTRPEPTIPPPQTAEEWEKEHYTAKPPAKPKKAASASAKATETEKPAVEVPRDKLGFPIPAHLLARWRNWQRVQDLMTLAKNLKCALETAYEDKDHSFASLFVKISFQQEIKAAKDVYGNLSECRPDVVCPHCRGLYRDRPDTKSGNGVLRKCHNCKDTGFIADWQWTVLKNGQLANDRKLVLAHLELCNQK